jgi:hypothetical protein
MTFLLSAFTFLRSSWLGKALAAIILIRRDAKQDARREDREKDTNRALDIHKRADDALRDADGADAADWLRSRGKLRD